jgi:hypothetical protein
MRMLSDTVERARIFWYRAGVLPKCLRAAWRGYTKWRAYGDWQERSDTGASAFRQNPLRDFFSAHKEGRGIWKWNHYFDIYDLHFNRFRGSDVHILEVGIYSGGSLEMWQSYFGPRSKIYGVDIEPACKAYESDSVRVYIGDQADRGFWRRFKQEVPVVDIVIDDGGHLLEQQIVTLEELLPHLQPAGIYLCEDVHGAFNEFASYVFGLAQNLNASDQSPGNPDDNERRLVSRARPLQQAVGAVHLYPYVTLIERTTEPVSELIAPKRGTKWEPFLS